ncbi:TPA: hypothetical protein J2F85_003419 [Escherichia coli]|nr:hypothetical protein [Escherichia coli]
METTVECIKDYHGEEAEVKVIKIEFSDSDLHLVNIDFNPDDESYPSTYMLYTPDQARQLAVYLMEAANRADKGIHPDGYNQQINHKNGS